MRVFGAAIVSLAVLVCATGAYGDLQLQYLGGFRAISESPFVYYGGLTYYPLGDGGSGSLFISVSPVGAGKEIYEVGIPSLVISSNVNDLNISVPLTSFDVSTNPDGLAWRPADDLLYFSREEVIAGARYRSIQRDGMGESAERAGPTWREEGRGLTVIPDDWAAAHTGGKSVLTVSYRYGPRISAVDPWNDPVSETPLVAYSLSNPVIDYDSADRYEAIEWVTVGTESNVIVAGKDSSEAAATLWFYNADDIANAGNLWDPQPYQKLSVEDVMFTGADSLYGLTYDPANQILYGYEGGWGQPTVVHAWHVVPEPATVALLAAAGVLGLIRRR